MGRAPCCDKTKVKRGPWSPDEDNILKNYIHEYGTGGNWISLPQKAGLKRCGKSCRLRWLNYLRPNIKHGGFTEEEDNIILTLYQNIGSRWSVIASHLPERTDNDVKNYWNTKLKKKLIISAPTNTDNVNFAVPSSETIYNINSNYSVKHDNSIMLPYFPMEVIHLDQEIPSRAQIPLPKLESSEIGDINIAYNFGTYPSQDVTPSFSLDDNISASTSWSSTIDTFLSAFEFKEEYSDEMNQYSDFDYATLSNLLGNDSSTET